LLRRAAGDGRRRETELPDAELDHIFSVSCLKAKQLDPSYPCRGFEEVSEEDLMSIGKAPVKYPLDLGNFPNWQESRCNSDGAFLCDPDSVLRPSERSMVARALGEFRDQTLVTCGRLEESLVHSDTVLSKRHFNLAVVVLGTWPVAESDPASLQKLGQLVSTRWGLMPIYNGVDASNPTDEFLSRREYTANCPNAAVLIVMPELGAATFSTPSCEFICAERGGREVTAAVEFALKRGAPLGEAIITGIQQVAAVLRVGLASPATMAEAGLTRERRFERELRESHERFLHSDAYIVGVQRALFAVILASIAFALGAFLYHNCSPRQPSLTKLG